MDNTEASSENLKNYSTPMTSYFTQKTPVEILKKIWSVQQNKYIISAIVIFTSVITFVEALPAIALLSALGFWMLSMGISAYFDDYRVVFMKKSYFGVKHGHLRSFLGQKCDFKPFLGQNKS